MGTAIPLRKEVMGDYHELKTKIHGRLMDMMDLSLIGTVDENVLRQEIRKLTEKIVVDERFPLNYGEREKLFKDCEKAMAWEGGRT